jgi:hypothetical protein
VNLDTPKDMSKPHRALLTAGLGIGLLGAVLVLIYLNWNACVQAAGKGRPRLLPQLSASRHRHGALTRASDGSDGGSGTSCQPEHFLRATPTRGL